MKVRRQAHSLHSTDSHPSLNHSIEARAPQQLPIFDLILLFPLLEGLTAAVDRTQADDNDGPDGLPTITLPSTPPMTGSLNLYKVTEMKPFALLLLSIPGGFHFRELNLTLTREDDLSSVTALVEGCSQTLKHLDITSNWPGMSIWHCIRIALSLVLLLGEPGSGLIDLSKATRLETVTFQVGSYYVGWATKALRTIATEHRDLRQIAILIPSDIACVRVGTDIERTLGKTIYRWWSDLDRLLVEFWKSRSIRPRLGPARMWEIKEDMEFCIGDLLLDVIERRIFDLV